MFIGIDLGTSSVKTVLLDGEGRSHGEGHADYPVYTPQPGWAESDPGEWWNSTCRAVRQCVGVHGSEVRAIGLSGQMHGLVLVDSAGTPVRPAILWADTRSRHVLQRYDVLPAAQREALANPIVAGMAGPSLLWVRDREPETYTAARWALQPKDWIRFKLAGVMVGDPSDASATLLYDLPADGWALAVVDRLELRAELLPVLAESGSAVGELRPEAARELGLRAGITIAAGAGDTPAAALGNGVIVPGEGQLSIGTAGQIIAPLAVPEPDPALHTHLFRSAMPGAWYAMAAMQNVGLALEWVRSVLGVSWETLYDDAFSVAPGAEELSFLPYISGERTPVLDPAARGAWVGLGLHHSRPHLLRAALEGVAFAVKDGLEALEARAIHLPELRLAGGGAEEPRWLAMLARVLQCPLHSTARIAASARGAALLAGIATRCFADAAATRDFAPPIEKSTYPHGDCSSYDEAYRRYQALYPRLRGL